MIIFLGMRRADSSDTREKPIFSSRNDRSFFTVVEKCFIANFQIEFLMKLATRRKMRNVKMLKHIFPAEEAVLLLLLLPARALGPVRIVRLPRQIYEG